MSFRKFFQQRIDRTVLKVLSKVYKKFFPPNELKLLSRETDPDLVSKIIMETLNSNNPVMIGRFGATELMCILNYIGVKEGRKNIFQYISKRELDWWWNRNCFIQIEQWSGFFPPTKQNVEQFCKLMLNDIHDLDVLVSWLSTEIYLKDYFKKAILVQGLFLDPFWSNCPWTKILEGKRVLVVHPFENAIKIQYKKRELLFKNKDILPEFKLITLRAIQSLGGDCEFSSWFEALDYLKSQIDQIEFDICLLGCGSYGFPLAAYIKRKGKKAVHWGGSLQLLFGIKGKRWENPLYGSTELGKVGMYPELFNEYWIYPGEEGKPKNANKVEGACYW